MIRIIKSPLSKLFDAWGHGKVISEKEQKEILFPFAYEKAQEFKKNHPEEIGVQHTDHLTKIWFMDRGKII